MVDFVVRLNIFCCMVQTVSFLVTLLLSCLVKNRAKANAIINPIIPWPDTVAGGELKIKKH